MNDDVIFHTSWGSCVRVPSPAGKPQRYAIVTTAGALLGELRWQGSTRRYVLLPAAQSVWCSQWLSEVGVWLRRLTRSALGARQP
jgi:hypothetical protein